MTYLGYTNIAAPTVTARDFQRAQLLAQAPKPTAPPVLIRPAPTTTTLKPLAPTYPGVPRVTPSTPLIPPTLPKPLPTLMTVKQGEVAGTAGMKPAPSGSILTRTVDTVTTASQSSPLPLILFGLVGLMLVMRKGR